MKWTVMSWWVLIHITIRLSISMVGLNPNAKVFNSSLSQTNNENLKQTEINSMGLSELNPNAKEFAFTGGGNVTVYKAKGPKNALQLQFMQSRNHQSERRYSTSIIGAPILCSSITTIVSITC